MLKDVLEKKNIPLVPKSYIMVEGEMDDVIEFVKDCEDGMNEVDRSTSVS